MKRVFSREKWIELNGLERYLELRDILKDEYTEFWVDECDGLTESEMCDIGYAFPDDCSIEIDEEDEFEDIDGEFKSGDTVDVVFQLLDKIRPLIRNQKKIIERLKSED